MATSEHLHRERLHTIITSYELDGGPQQLDDRFHPSLDRLRQHYPPALVELAFVEVLAHHWLRTPRPQGVRFLALVRRRLRQWQQPPIESTLTRSQFHHITGLDPAPIFGPLPSAAAMAFPDSDGVGGAIAVPDSGTGAIGPDSPSLTTRADSPS
ncbi:MAG: hypothetical protein O3C67_07515 [Cyanobacteria bacterium]|nr:hypothetical protein [Cyanobacteriota bacterium]